MTEQQQTGQLTMLPPAALNRGARELAIRKLAVQAVSQSPRSPRHFSSAQEALFFAQGEQLHIFFDYDVSISELDSFIVYCVQSANYRNHAEAHHAIYHTGLLDRYRHEPPSEAPKQPQIAVLRPAPTPSVSAPAEGGKLSRKEQIAQKKKDAAQEKADRLKITQKGMFG